ncbi:MAG: hypothetical protein WDN26_07585 [Chitinophagaceae bacterium]
MKSFFRIALLTGLFVGTTDILMAYTNSFIKTGNFAEKMFHYIAGGALGLEKSMQGGTGVALLGLFFHYFIAMSFTFFFFWIFPKFKFLVFNKYVVGILYAVFVNLAMRYLILPLTALPAGGAFILERAFIDWILLGIVLGIPIVYNTYKFYGVKKD